MDHNEAMKQLAALITGSQDALRGNPEFATGGKVITLPEGMTETEAIEWLDRRRKEQDTKVAVRELIPGYPLDALLALQRAMKETYGWTDLVPTPTFFGPRPPVMVGVAIDEEGTTVQVPWGRMEIPGIKGHIAPSIEYDKNGQPMLLLVGEVQRRSEKEVAKLADLARKEVTKNSIYKGKAVRISFEAFDEDDNPFNPQTHAPSFLRLNGVQRSDLVYKEDVEWAVNTNIFLPIENIAKLRAMQTPFRRGVLAAGPYGVGKTLLANVVGKVAQEKNITFIYLDKTSDLAMARRFAAQYAPAVIFAEDIDAVLGGDDRDEDVNDILNVLDGVEGKHDEVMVILSTNHPERINRALLRPGRIDAVITVEPPDAPTVQRLVRKYAGSTLPKSEELGPLGEQLTGHIPAAIREVVERAKLAAIPRAKDGHVRITAEDLVSAANSMKGHLAMLGEKVEARHSELEKLAVIIGSHIQHAISICNCGQDHDGANETLNAEYARAKKALGVAAKA